MVTITAFVCRYCDGTINVPLNAKVTIVGGRKCQCFDMENKDVATRKICGSPMIRISNEFDDREIGAKK